MSDWRREGGNWPHLREKVPKSHIWLGIKQGKAWGNYKGGGE